MASRVILVRFGWYWAVLETDGSGWQLAWRDGSRGGGVGGWGLVL